MKLLYSSHGDFSEILNEARPPHPSQDDIKKGLDILQAPAEKCPLESLKVLSPKDLNMAGAGCDPQFFLLLRELSVYMRRDIERRINTLKNAGFVPKERTLLRFGDNTNPLEVLCAGIAMNLSGTEGIFSFSNSSFTSEAASAMRLSGVKSAHVGDAVASLMTAVRLSHNRDRCKNIIAASDPLFAAVASLLSTEINVTLLPERAHTLCILEDRDALSLLLCDLECESLRSPVVVICDDGAATEISSRTEGKDGFLLVTSSKEESAKISEKCQLGDTRIYGALSSTIKGYDAKALSPLMAASAIPTTVFPYTPDVFLTPAIYPDTDLSVFSFASSVAKFAEKGVLSEPEIAAIGERMQ